MNFQVLLEEMLSGAMFTGMIFGLTLLFALPLGLILSFGRMSKLKIVRIPIQLYLLVMRGTPLMLQLMFVFFGLPFVGIVFDRFTACIIAFSLNYAAYFAEIYRGGIQSIPQGQYEAARVLGFTKGQTFLKIILPQVIKQILPPMGNEFITLVKDTSLALTISVIELMNVTKTFANSAVSVVPYIIAALFYLVMNGIVTLFFSALEKKLSYYR
ncbi:MAG TPA: amino acid ABC transporter permease [Candidatus Scatavimonas merdigallinarum]|uniref:Amino acid ABC transporter permease n=1 Tax=Candidatus Scatavimonas merdigallinarum TaxID=2840914 RepID=A0A9D1CTQ2_9FIRM|nr:amino acid ABC transporter permease [Candidatus Scatavimonas merdigallinarum]